MERVPTAKEISVFCKYWSSKPFERRVDDLEMRIQNEPFHFQHQQSKTVVMLNGTILSSGIGSH
ncbi:hypothetical protein [Myroides guanonis]|uniref:hypothetical protein n=1 Tax=Myroides guanonis TaxID=1150112 RepID=UPI001160C0C5|nr:hypothetical protein [Myroides guanonis]